MTPHVGQATIFLPVLAIVVLTVLGFGRLIVLRTRTIRGRQVSLGFYRAFQGAAEPEATAAAARHYINLFEAPVLFYLGCVVTFEIGAVTPWTLAFAWGYVLARAVQSAIHLGTNNVRHRALAFMFGWIFLIALWVDVAVALVQQI